MSRSWQPDRRQIITLAGALLATGVVTRSASAAVPQPPPGLPIPWPPGRMLSPQYRPVAVSSPYDLPHFPADAHPVRWRWARASHTSIQDAIATLRRHDVLVLPEDEAAYEVDSSRGFRRGPYNYYSMCSTTRGIVGLGPGAVIRPSASAFRAGRQRYSRGLQEKVIESRIAGAYFGNFTMYGRDFGGCGYNAIWASGAGTVWENIHFRGAHRGWLPVPPGEAGAICGYRGTGMRVFNCEIDCRDEAGRSVGTSPLMWNCQSDVQLHDVYAHHTYVGMPTFWQVHDASATKLIHTHVAQGASPSSGVNVEDCSGRFQFDDCTFKIGYGPSNHGLHLSTGRQRRSIRFDIRNPTIDAGPWPGVFSIQEFLTTAQQKSDFHLSRGDGTRYPFRVAR